MFNGLNNFVATLLRSKKYIDNPWIFRAQVFIYNQLIGTRNGIFKIKSISDLLPDKKILAGYKYRSRTQNDIEVSVPDLKQYFIEDAIINSRSSAIIKGNEIYYESINHNERFNEGFVKYHSKKYAFVDLSKMEFIDEGFFLAGNGSYNWYHWLLEILPKMMYFKEEQTRVILVDESVETIPSMKDTLRVFTECLNVKIIYLDHSKAYNVKRLFFINEINKLMYNAIDNDLEMRPLYYYRQESVQALRLAFLKNTTNQKLTSVKIYLERKNTHRIAKNENSLLTILQNQGFRNIDLVGLNLRDQINVFKNASLVIGTTGAAWTNVLFCESNTKCIIFMPNNYKTYQFYAELAQMLQVEVKYLFYENGLENHEKSDFVINLNELENLLETSYE